MNITEFKINDEIVRVERAFNGDVSYIGEKFIFKGTLNGLIQLDGGFTLKICHYDNGWKKWIDPITLYKIKEEIKTEVEVFIVPKYKIVFNKIINYFKNLFNKLKK